MKTFELIKLRRSVRTYKKEAINENHIHLIRRYLKDHSGNRGPFGHAINLQEIAIDNPKKFGTYGIIKNPPMYIAGTCEKTDLALVDFGYIFEKMIIDLTDEELGTCWMAGTFKRSEFESEVQIGDLEIMPAVTPVGYFEDKRTFESVMRKVVKADNRTDFSKMFFLENFKTPLKEDQAFMFKSPLESVRLGPSASNKQPWRALVSEDLKKVHFYLEETPNYNKALGFPVQMIDMGIALYHFEAVCRELHIDGKFVKNRPKLDTPNNNYQYIITFE
jgi:nitroreductase